MVQRHRAVAHLRWTGTGRVDRPSSHYSRVASSSSPLHAGATTTDQRSHRLRCARPPRGSPRGMRGRRRRGTRRGRDPDVPSGAQQLRPDDVRAPPPCSASTWSVPAARPRRPTWSPGSSVDKRAMLEPHVIASTPDSPGRSNPTSDEAFARRSHRLARSGCGFPASPPMGSSGSPR